MATSPSEGSWKQTLQQEHWTYLLENLNVDKIADELLQGVQRRPLITEDVYDKIGKAESKKDANKIYLNHLKNTGTHEVLGVFCKVLRNTSKAYHIHEVIAARLENDTNLWHEKIREHPALKPIMQAYIEEELVAFPDLKELNDSYDNVMLKLSKLLGKLKNNELKIVRNLIRTGSNRYFPCKSHFIDVSQSDLELYDFLDNWSSPLDVRLIKTVAAAVKKAKKKKGLTSCLEDHAALIKGFSKEALKTLKQKRLKRLRSSQVCTMAVKVKVDPGQYLLEELFRLKAYLITDIGIDKTFFEGFTGGSTLLFFRISLSTGMTILPALISHMAQLKESFKVEMIVIFNHFALDVERGIAYSLHIQGQELCDLESANAQLKLELRDADKQREASEKQSLVLESECKHLKDSNSKLNDKLVELDALKTKFAAKEEELKKTQDEKKQLESRLAATLRQAQLGASEKNLDQEGKEKVEEGLLYCFTTDVPVLEEKVDKGPYATVYKGKLDNKSIAVKKVDMHLLAKVSSSDPKGVKKKIYSFLRECNKLKAVKHQNIVEFIGAFGDISDEGSILMAAELMSKNLKDYLEDKKGHLPDQKQVNICYQIALGLQYLHETKPDPILHLGLTTRNVLVNEDGTIFKVGDFGQSQLRPIPVAESTDFPDNQLFMAPELLTSAAKEGQRSLKSDIFSLGAVMLVVATQKELSKIFPVTEGQSQIKFLQADIEKVLADHPLSPVILECLRGARDARPVIDDIVDKLLYILTHKLIKSESEFFRAELLLKGNHNFQSIWLPDMPTQMRSASAILHNNHIFVSGGVFEDRDTKMAVCVQDYDIQTRTWNILPPAPQYHSQAAIVGGLLTLIGGLGASRHSRTKDLSSWTGGKWEPVFPATKRIHYRPGVVSHDNLLVVAGGSENDSKQKMDDIEVLHVPTKQWSSPVNLRLPKPLSNLKMAVCNEIIYVYDAQGKRNVWKMQWAIFKSLLTEGKVPADQEAQARSSWEDVRKAPVRKSALLPNSTHPILIGGQDSGSNPTGAIFVYQPTENVWTKVGSLKENRHGISVVTVNATTVMALGGTSRSDDRDGETFKTVEMLQVVKTVAP